MLMQVTKLPKNWVIDPANDCSVLPNSELNKREARFPNESETIRLTIVLNCHCAVSEITCLLLCSSHQVLDLFVYECDFYEVMTD